VLEVRRQAHRRLLGERRAGEQAQEAWIEAVVDQLVGRVVLDEDRTVAEELAGGFGELGQGRLDDLLETIGRDRPARARLLAVEGRYLLPEVLFRRVVPAGLGAQAEPI